MKAVKNELTGWGNYPAESCYVSRPETLEMLRGIVVDGGQPNYIPRGLGRSYGDSALNLNSGVVIQTRLNRFLSFDDRTGVLECEAGVSFADIIDHFLPRGWFVPTTPGTKYLTVGGAIAADVHGKNHHSDGSFGQFVLSFDLLGASGEILVCSPTQNAPLFEATLGGMGLTGIIVSARIQLIKVESAFFDVIFQRTSDLEETLDAFSTNDQLYRYSVAWIDCLASGGSLGRSVLMFANGAMASDLPAPICHHPLTVPVKRKKSIPIFLPAFMLNEWTVKAFNALYYRAHRSMQKIVDYDTFFYPLDGLLHWNRIYGRRGFFQYQALFPLKTARRGLVELLERISDYGRPSFLAVLKRSGSASSGMLSFLYPGYTLALDIPNLGGNVRQLVRELDETLLKYDGRLYLAKDALMTGDTFAASYPRLPEFRAIKANVDPNNRFVSSQAKRLKIVETG